MQNINQRVLLNCGPKRWVELNLSLLLSGMRKKMKGEEETKILFTKSENGWAVFFFHYCLALTRHEDGRDDEWFDFPQPFAMGSRSSRSSSQTLYTCHWTTNNSDPDYIHVIQEKPYKVHWLLKPKTNGPQTLRLFIIYKIIIYCLNFLACDGSCTVSLSCALSSLSSLPKDPAGSNRNPELMDSVHGREEFGAHMEPKRREIYVRSAS